MYGMPNSRLFGLSTGPILYIDICTLIDIMSDGTLHSRPKCRAGCLVVMPGLGLPGNKTAHPPCGVDCRCWTIEQLFSRPRAWPTRGWVGLRVAGKGIEPQRARRLCAQKRAPWSSVQRRRCCRSKPRVDALRVYPGLLWFRFPATTLEGLHISAAALWNPLRVRCVR
jgi:hypothetical protein